MAKQVYGAGVNSPLINQYDMADGNTNVSIGTDIGNFTSVNLFYQTFGFDANDATVVLQGSIDNINWSDIESKTITGVNAYVVIASWDSATEFTATGDITAQLANGATIQVVGSTENDGFYTVTAFEEDGGDTVITVAGATFDTTPTAPGVVAVATVSSTQNITDHRGYLYWRLSATVATVTEGVLTVSGVYTS